MRVVRVVCRVRAHTTVKYQSVIDYSEGVAMYLEAKKQRRRIVKELTLEYASHTSPLQKVEPGL